MNAVAGTDSKIYILWIKFHTVCKVSLIICSSRNPRYRTVSGRTVWRWLPVSTWWWAGLLHSVTKIEVFRGQAPEHGFFLQICIKIHAFVCIPEGLQNGWNDLDEILKQSSDILLQMKFGSTWINRFLSVRQDGLLVYYKVVNIN